MSAIIPLKAFFPYNRPAPSGASRRVGARRDVFSGIFFSLIWHARCRAEEHKDAAGAGLSPRSHAHVDTAVASPAHTCLLGSDFVADLACPLQGGRARGRRRTARSAERARRGGARSTRHRRWRGPRALRRCRGQGARARGRRVCAWGGAQGRGGRRLEPQVACTCRHCCCIASAYVLAGLGFRRSPRQHARFKPQFAVTPDACFICSMHAAGLLRASGTICTPCSNSLQRHKSFASC